MDPFCYRPVLLAAAVFHTICVHVYSRIPPRVKYFIGADVIEVHFDGI